MCDLKVLVFARALVVLDCISYERARLSLKQVSSRRFERFTSCFCLSSNFDSISFILANRAGTSTKQVRARERSPSYSKGISKQPKAIFDFGNQWRLGSWFNFMFIIIIVAPFMLNPSHWGLILNYDYAFLKLFVIIMKSYAWLL